MIHKKMSINPISQVVQILKAPPMRTTHGDHNKREDHASVIASLCSAFLDLCEAALLTVWLSLVPLDMAEPLDTLSVPALLLYSAPCSHRRPTTTPCGLESPLHLTINHLFALLFTEVVNCTPPVSILKYCGGYSRGSSWLYLESTKPPSSCTHLWETFLIWSFEVQRPTSKLGHTF